MTTNEDKIKALSTERQARISEAVAKEVAKWGGVRVHSGRKKAVEGQVLSFTKRLTEKEAQFINYARNHNINYDEIMQG